MVNNCPRCLNIDENCGCCLRCLNNDYDCRCLCETDEICINNECFCILYDSLIKKDIDKIDTYLNLCVKFGRVFDNFDTYCLHYGDEKCLETIVTLSEYQIDIEDIDSKIKELKVYINNYECECEDDHSDIYGRPEDNRLKNCQRCELLYNIKQLTRVLINYNTVKDSFHYKQYITFKKYGFESVFNGISLKDLPLQ